MAFWWVETFTHERAIERTVKAAKRVEFFEDGKRLGELHGEPLRKLLENFQIIDASKAWDWEARAEPLRIQLIGPPWRREHVWVGAMGTADVRIGFWEKVREALRE